ncbi:signal peptidase II [Arthrobacter sp. CAL618]|uniref:signal peptidase II n=1 Tax=Arthrobacter sp. CAL618 TaxID=1055770 RepID=UPI0004242565|nr:signal peptidase II [Arthrobacter sp. CAL618]
MSVNTAAQAETTPAPAMRIRATLLIWAVVLAAADLAIKAVAETLLAGGELIDLGLLNFRLYYNTGVAFSLGADLPSWVIIAGTGLIIVGLAWYLLQSAPTINRLARAGGELLLGGAIGNFVDRLAGRGVVDYLHTGWFPTFNLADVFVTTGVAVFVLATFWRSPAVKQR